MENDSKPNEVNNKDNVEMHQIGQKVQNNNNNSARPFNQDINNNKSNNLSSAPGGILN